MFEVLPCPICKGTAPLLCPEERVGKAGRVHAGVMSSERMGVRCFHCKLQVDVELPSRWPRNTPKSLKGMKAIHWLRKYCLKKAVIQWNKLPRT